MRRSIHQHLALLLLAVLPSTGVVVWTAVSAFQLRRDTTNEYIVARTVTIERASSLAAELDDAQITALELLLSTGTTQKLQTSQRLLTSISTSVGLDLEALHSELAGDKTDLTGLATVAARWAAFQKLLVNGLLSGASRLVPPPSPYRLTGELAPAAATTVALVQHEQALVAAAHLGALRRYDDRVWLLFLFFSGSVLLAGASTAALARSLRTRTAAHLEFAEGLTRGRLHQRLDTAGGGDGARLARALNELAHQREVREVRERQKSAFTDALQRTTHEAEARGLLKRYLERSLTPAKVTILAKNSAGDHLEAMTPLPPDSPLRDRLELADPSDCLAIRMARPYRDRDRADALMSCSLCATSPGATTCTPLLIGGEVLGAVLVNRETPFRDSEESSIQESVALIAPTLDNLRHLAIAEWRAATDSLTGLPNKRALGDTLRQMVAQSSRTSTPLAALMCDLDHFKEVNDRVGHHRGDELLAAVASTFKHILRASDFACRYGGEEFLALLPATSLDGARIIAEKLRAAVGELRIPGIPRAITLSVGIALLPDHAVDAISLQQAADRAMYAAKNTGRNRVAVFSFAPGMHRQEPLFGPAHPVPTPERA